MANRPVPVGPVPPALVTRLALFLLAFAAKILLLVVLSEVGDDVPEVGELKSNGCDPPPMALDGRDDVGVDPPVPRSPPVPLLKAVNRLEALLAAPVAAELVLLSQEPVEAADVADDEERLFVVMPSSVSLGVSSGAPSSPVTM